MLSFIVRRLLIIIPMALVVVTLTWGLIRIAPGNFYSGEKKLPAAVEATIRKKYGLDKPWYQQYGMMISNIVQGDFGDSLKYPGQTVNEIIRRHLPYSATIGILGYLLALAVGLTAGTVAALSPLAQILPASLLARRVGWSWPCAICTPFMSGMTPSSSVKTWLFTVIRNFDSCCRV